MLAVTVVLSHCDCNGNVVKLFTYRVLAVFVLSPSESVNEVMTLSSDLPRLIVVSVRSLTLLVLSFSLVMYSKHLILGLTHEWFREPSLG